MKKILIYGLCIFYLIIGVSSMSYTGQHQLCIRNISGNVTCLLESDSYNLSNDSTYHFTLNSKPQEKNLEGIVDYLIYITKNLLIGIVIFAGLYLLVMKIIF